MAERLIALSRENGRASHLSKDSSMNTDDDDSIQQTNLSNTDELPVDGSIRNSLLASPSIDSINDLEGSGLGNLSLEKVRKRKQRRTLDKMNSIDQGASIIKKRSWFPKVDLIKPLMFIAFLFFVYLMWVKRDVWIPRLLTSNSRIRYSISRNDEKLNEQKSQLDSNSNSSSSSNENSKENQFDQDKDQALEADSNDDDDDSPTISNKHSGQKINIRVRRNKMSFSKDKPTKKHRHSTNQANDDVDDDDGDNDDTEEEVVIKSPKKKLPLSNKHHHHHHQEQRAKTDVILRQDEDLIEQLKKLVKSKGKYPDLFAFLSKQTGLSKSKINRLVQSKDLSFLTLEQFLHLLNSLQSTILIVPK